ncbi:MAG: leucyl aminopeptidase family protein [Chromatiales bacterium]|jgi:leucyl aminopeptidase|nr:leucyl aminopeptidase family protein [Chromatiales bacterium]
MQFPFVNAPSADSLATLFLTSEQLPKWRENQSERVRRWLDTARFAGKAGTHCIIPGEDGRPAQLLVGRASDDWLWAMAHLPNSLGPVICELTDPPAPHDAALAALGFGLGAYRFTRYGAKAIEPAKLVIPANVDATQLHAELRAISLTRDLINTAAADMMPEHLSATVSALADEFGGSFAEIVGDDLLAQDYPAVHAVGRASAHAPRLLDLRWQSPNAKRSVTLVGKGVCFDSGGLDLKPASGMRLMKKDMGGAATALGLASRIMANELPVRLRVLIPAVENAVSGNAFRPGDVLSTRAGLTVEIDNTDAEGRLILCDALHEAGSERPDAIIDFATLTGAARIAVGTELPALFSNNDDLAEGLLSGGLEVSDPVWRLPLHQPYRQMLNSNIADMVNSASVPHGGAITAALFLERFVPAGVNWAHFDIMAWNTRNRPGRPEGGEAMAMRAVYQHLNAWSE